MPSGKEHNNINQTILLGLVFVGACFIRDNVALYWSFILGLAIGTNYLGPDLDLNNSVQDQNHGIFQIYWNPYSKWFRHRGISHHFVGGFLSRLLYLSPILILIIYFRKNVVLVYWREIGVSFLGVMAADWLHILEDWFFHGRDKKKNFRRKK